jgi:magnesium transporter
MDHLPGPEEEIEKFRARIEHSATDTLIDDFHQFRGEALHLLRDIKPLEDVLSQLASTEDDFVSPAARAKFKDALDNQQRAVDTLNHLAEESKELMNLTLAMASHKMNEIMQVLTIVSALLIPPTLVAGVYGMNFEHMPELRWRFGYGGAIIAMVATSAFQIWLFVQNGWWVNPFRFTTWPKVRKFIDGFKQLFHRSP